MPERLIVTPLEAHVTVFNEVFGDHYSETIARVLHGDRYWRSWYHPESRTLRPEDIMHDAQRSDLFCDRIDQALGTLTDRERIATRIRFGLVDGKLHTLGEVGYEFGITRSRAQQIEAKAIRKLRHPRRSNSLREFFPKNQ